jgi:hypothetical protein
VTLHNVINQSMICIAWYILIDYTIYVNWLHGIC